MALMKNAFTAGLLCAVLMLSGCGRTAVRYPAVQEYVPGQGNIQGSVDTAHFMEADPAFAIGARQDGCAVYQDPAKALSVLKKKYADGINLIRQEYQLKELNVDFYEDYKTYGWQVSTGSAEEQEQAHFVTQFLDIYENSFEE